MLEEYVKRLKTELKEDLLKEIGDIKESIDDRLDYVIAQFLSCHEDVIEDSE